MYEIREGTLHELKGREENFEYTEIELEETEEKGNTYVYGVCVLNLTSWGKHVVQFVRKGLCL